MTTTLWKEIEALSREEKIELLAELKKSVGEAYFVLSDEQKAELDRRIEDMERNPDDEISYEEFKKEFGLHEAHSPAQS